MKKILLFLLILVGTLTVQASLTPRSAEGHLQGKNLSTEDEGNFTYLTFETTDGTKISVSVESLTLSISGTTLTAGSQSFTLSNLTKMYFSNADETTGISEELILESEESFANAEYYDLQGKMVAPSQLTKGVYIVKTNSKTFKLVVK